MVFPLESIRSVKPFLEHDITARELSRVTGVPQSTITNYLSGRSANKLEHLMAIADYFKVELGYLLFEESRSEPSLSEVLTEQVFDGWLRAKIERAVPLKRKGSAKKE